MIIEQILSDPVKFGHYLGYDKLQPVNGEWIRKAFLRKENYTLQAHRGSYKTTSILVVGILLYMTFNLNSTILVCRKEQTGASSILTQIGKHIRNGDIQPIIEAMYEIKDFHIINQNLESLTHSLKISVTKEGSLEAIGIGGASTGRHYDLIIADDIVTLKDRISKAERERTKLFLMELFNILNPGGKLIMTGSPWHKDDAFSLMDEIDKYDIYSTEIPDFTEARIAELRRRMTPSLFAANYELKHIADGSKIFNDPVYEQWPNNYSIGHIDAAYGGGNTTAFTLKSQGQMIFKGWVWEQDITELYQTIANLAKENRCQAIHMEKNADKGFARRDLQEYFPNVEIYHESQNKYEKIRENAKYNWPEIRFAYETQHDYLNQILDYEEGQGPDDAVDSLATIIRIYRNDNYLVGENVMTITEIKDEWKV